MKKMGPLESLIDLLPKGGAFKGLRAPQSVDEKALTRTTAIIDSMTREERRYPQILNGSRKKRVASGSGTSVAEINRLIKQYQEMRKMMKAAKKGMRGLDMSKMAFPGPKGQSQQ
jgi:signal recognition particle subunit SRP54